MRVPGQRCRVRRRSARGRYGIEKIIDRTANCLIAGSGIEEGSGSGDGSGEGSGVEGSGIEGSGEGSGIEGSGEGSGEIGGLR